MIFCTCYINIALINEWCIYIALCCSDVTFDTEASKLVSTKHLTLGAFDFKKAALHRMVSVLHQSTARMIREQTDPMLSNGSRGTLMSYTDHSVQRRFRARPNEALYRSLIRFAKSTWSMTSEASFTWKPRDCFSVSGSNEVNLSAVSFTLYCVCIVLFLS